MSYKNEILFAVYLSTVCLAPLSVFANTITVTNTNDSGPGSLRDGLAAANDGDTIDATGVSGTILLSSGELQIMHNVTINGPGAKSLAVNGNATSRAFENFASDVTISGFTITNGLPPTDDNNGGGGILNHGGLTLISTSILNNNAGGFQPLNAGGGGIGISAGGTLTVTTSIISGNESQNGPGGGISADGTVTISNSTINNNEALCTGGGVALSDTGGALTVMDSTITGNSVLGCPVSARVGWASTGGGGIGSSGSVTVSNSTISGNTVAEGGVPATGGGVACSGSMTVSNSTISGNTVNGYMCEGGGIHNGGTLTLTNSTFSGNSAAPSGQGGALSNAGQTMIGDTVLNIGPSGGTIFNNGGAITSLGYNIATDKGGGVLTGPGDQINTDPILGPLQDNGGPTFTHALLPGSPAIDTGDPNFTPPPLYDQRGLGYPRMVNDRIDIGSFEVQSVGTPTPTPTSTPRHTPTPRPRPTPLPRPNLPR